MSRIDRTEGRRLFGSDPAAYDRARPGHAERVYDVLVERCGLGPGTSVLEVGPGTGQATRRLLDLGAAPLVAVEPDPALASHVESTLGEHVDVRVATLEDAELPPESFDLTVAASSFHWVDEAAGLEMIHACLRPGGWVALWWTLFGDHEAPDAFITATTPLLEGLHSSPTAGAEGRPPFARDRETRFAALEAGGFDGIEHLETRWIAHWDAEGIRELYGTFSPIARLDEPARTGILDEIGRIAREDFGGRVERKLLTSLYTARKPE